MSKPNGSSDAEHAARLFKLLADTDPENAKARADRAARHGGRVRRRPAASATVTKPPAEIHEPQPVRDRHAPAASAATSVEQPPIVYVHQTPTSSAVLNAFIHAFGAYGLVPDTVGVPDEHLLAPRLVEVARRHWSMLLRMAGHEELADEVEERTAPIENELAARFIIRRALGTSGELGAIARDYDEHHKRAGAPERDDWVAHAMMATFAGRLLQHASNKLGPYVRDDVRRVLQALTVTSSLPARQVAVRVSVLPPAGEASLATAPRRRRRV
ncbi:Hypothetical protein A7982_09266 [Minicystis rosea]|nr:Hypothetical protein A7982_09266 [Minicystis rosea]